MPSKEEAELWKKQLVEKYEEACYYISRSKNGSDTQTKRI